MDCSIEIYEFNQLIPKDLYGILKLRSDVFIVEQECAYDDIDGNDLQALHLIIRDEDSIAACCRILSPGVTFPTYAIGRLATEKDHRNRGYARRLMNTAIEYITEQFNPKSIMISGQAYLVGFYSGLGFKVVSELYLEDDIPHYDMELKIN
ncbi:MAG: GNAT family N-acetyltransferase [Oscillospiraceae bacterium]|nr:GNAT family N-acetyltransferase [Oscillospiraceae bacterium]